MEHDNSVEEENRICVCVHRRRISVKVNVSIRHRKHILISCAMKGYTSQTNDDVAAR